MPTTPVLNLPYPSPADTADVPRDMQALALAIDGQQSLLPVGAVILWVLANPPAGVLGNGRPAWLFLNGQSVAVADYPRLAALLGSSGGNVVLPDLQGRVPVGADGSSFPLWPAVGSAGGAVQHAISAAELPAHGHTLNGGVSNNAGFNSNATALTPAGYTIPYGNAPWQRRFLGAPSGATAVAWFTLEASPGNDGGESNLSHSHSLPAHGHGHSFSIANSPAPSQQTSLMQPFLTVNYAMRAA